ncbi:cupredoxin domain-containing protein [Paenibacillus ginsengarvi]|nr:cupredoxin domain-containing protein [Paenibacillus ginsengarvi]
MKAKIRKPAWLFAGLGILCIALVLIFFPSKPDPVDPLIAEQAAGYQVVTVMVTGDGFVPNQIELIPGVPAKINFKKTTGFTCIKGMIAEDIKLDVPLKKGNNLVTLDNLEPGTYKFHCDMYMYYGAITIKEKTVS